MRKIYSYRLRLKKSGSAIYTSHLDYMRAVGRSIRRAGLPLAYSQGFHPLPRLAPGPPLPLGVESRAEYLDLILTDGLKAEEVLGRLNKYLPPGLEVMEVREIKPGPGEKVPALTAVINRLTYSFLLKPPSNWSKKKFEEWLADLWAEKQLPVTREKKGERKTTDIRQLWKGYRLLPEAGDLILLEIETEFGPNGTIRPADLLPYFPKGVEIRRISREEAWILSGNRKLTPMAFLDEKFREW